MKKAALLSVLTASLALTSTQTTQNAALSAWADLHLPQITAQTRDLFKDGVSIGKIGKLAEAAVVAAQQLKGIFGGADRAKIAQTVLHVAVTELLPDPIERWALALVDGPGCAALIEAAFQRLDHYGKLASVTPTAPVVDASDVDAGGVQ